MRGAIETVDQSTIRLLDGLVIFWTVFWTVVGVWSAVTIWQISEIGDTVTSSGRALDTAGTALVKVGAVPVVGGSAGELGEQVVATAADISSRGQEVRGELRQLSLMLGISIVVMPTTPVVGLYVPLRLARRRETLAIRRALSQHGSDPQLDRHLAERALRYLPFTVVRSLTADPWRDIAEGNARRLADAELVRLGVHRPASPGPVAPEAVVPPDDRR